MEFIFFLENCSIPTCKIVKGMPKSPRHSIIITRMTGKCLHFLEMCVAGRTKKRAAAPMFKKHRYDSSADTKEQENTEDYLSGSDSFFFSSSVTQPAL